MNATSVPAVTACLGSIIEPHYGVDLVAAGAVAAVVPTAAGVRVATERAGAGVPVEAHAARHSEVMQVGTMKARAVFMGILC